MGVLVKLHDEVAKLHGWKGTRRRTVKLADGSTKTFTFSREPIEIPELYPEIEADRYLASKKAANDKKRGLKLNKIVPPGVN